MNPSETPEYSVWRAMKQRCTNPRHPRFADWGGRGIRVCDEWMQSFAAFIRDVGPRPSPRHSIDRIDNDDNYEPGNVRWATPEQQQYNRRCTGKPCCPHGHPYTPENTYIRPRNGVRICRTCARERMRDRYRAMADNP